jgi:hypothetical protein
MKILNYKKKSMANIFVTVPVNFSEKCLFMGAVINFLKTR